MGSIGDADYPFHSSGDDDPVGMGCGPCAGIGQTLGQAVELVAAIEAPGEAGKIALGVLGADMVVGAGERGLDVAQRGVDPGEGNPPGGLRPAPVTIGKWVQPAPSTAVQQERPSLTMLLPAEKSRMASVSISRLRKPLTTVSRSRLGLRSAVVSTAATNGVLPAAPRPACRLAAPRRDRRRRPRPGPRAWASPPRALPSPPSACA